MPRTRTSWLVAGLTGLALAAAGLPAVVTPTPTPTGGAPLRGIAAKQAAQHADPSQRGATIAGATPADGGGEEGEGDPLEVADQAEQYAGERSAPADSVSAAALLTARTQAAALPQAAPPTAAGSGRCASSNVGRMTDGGTLQRFVEAQDAGGTYERALAELRAGRKTSHWVWFVFPQLAGLGRSATAQRYALASLTEAQAYAGDPVLGVRLRQCATVLLDLPAAATAEGVLGGVDAMKLRSSMTLFARAVPEEPLFAAVLDRWFDGRPDDATDRLLQA